jgi:hypothetical protein
LKFKVHGPVATKLTTPPVTVQAVTDGAVVTVMGSPDVVVAVGVYWPPTVGFVGGGDGFVMVLRINPPTAANGPHVHASVDAPNPHVVGPGLIGHVSVPEAE